MAKILFPVSPNENDEFSHGDKFWVFKSGAWKLKYGPHDIINAKTGYKINNTNATLGHYLRGDGTKFISAQLNINDTPDNTLALSKIQNVSANTLLGNNTGLTGPVLEVSNADVKTMLGLGSVAYVDIGENSGDIRLNQGNEFKFADIMHDHDGVYEDYLGLPAANNYILKSSTAGVREWIQYNGMHYPTAGIAKSTGTTWAASIDDNSPNWDSAYNHSIATSGNVHGSTTVGMGVFRATNEANARSAIGAGTSNLALGELSTNAYRGDRGKLAYDHSQISGTPHVNSTEKNNWNSKEPAITVGTSGQFLRHDKTFVHGEDAGSSVTSFLRYNGTTRAGGRLYGGITDPSSDTRLNYDGYFHATQLFEGTSRLATRTYAEQQAAGSYKRQSSTVWQESSASNPSFNFDTSMNMYLTPTTGSTTLSITAMYDGESGVITLISSVDGTLTLPANSIPSSIPYLANRRYLITVVKNDKMPNDDLYLFQSADMGLIAI